MSDRIREAVSSFMDGEADELSIRRLLTQEDPSVVRSEWAAYHRQRRIIQKNDLRFEQMDVSLSVMSAIENERVYTEREQRVWLKPVAGLAVAASVAAVVVMGSPSFRQDVNSGVQNVALIESNEPSVSFDNTTQIPTAENAGEISSIYFAHTDVPAPVLNLSQRMGGGIPVSYKPTSRLTGASQPSVSYDIPFEDDQLLISSEIYFNGALRQPVLYKPATSNTYTNFSIQH